MRTEYYLAKKTALYILTLVAVYVLETANIPNTVFGVHIDILPCIPAAVALMEGPVLGGVMGLLTGMFYDVGMVGIEGLMPLYYMIFGVIAGVLSGRFLRKMFPSMLLITSIGMLILGFIRYAFSLLVMGVPFALAFQSICAEILATAVLSPIIYIIIRKIFRRYEWIQ